MRPPVPQPRPPPRTDPRRGAGTGSASSGETLPLPWRWFPAGSLIPSSLFSPGLAVRRLQPGAEAPRPRLPWGRLAALYCFPALPTLRHSQLCYGEVRWRVRERGSGQVLCVSAR